MTRGLPTDERYLEAHLGSGELLHCIPLRSTVLQNKTRRVCGLHQDKGKRSKTIFLSGESLFELPGAMRAIGDPRAETPEISTHIFLVIASLGFLQRLLELHIDFLGSGADGHTGPSYGRHRDLPGDEAGRGACGNHVNPKEVKADWLLCELWDPSGHTSSIPFIAPHQWMHHHQ